jgi:hypothetical protein
VRAQRAPSIFHSKQRSRSPRVQAAVCSAPQSYWPPVNAARPPVRSSSRRKLVTGADRSATNCPITSRRLLPWRFRDDERLFGEVIEIVARPRRFELLTFAFGGQRFILESHNRTASNLVGGFSAEPSRSPMGSLTSTFPKSLKIMREGGPDAYFINTACDSIVDESCGVAKPLWSRE